MRFSSMTKLRQKYIYYASIRGYLNVTATRSMIIIEAPLGVTFWGPSTSRGDADSYECRVDRMIDFKESGLRKMLNFGHTIGHALEAFYLDKDNYLTHGEAVALGMYSSLFLSVKYCGLDEKWLFFYELWFKGNYNFLNLKGFDLESIFSLISHDKKNKGGKPQFVLISAPEKPVIDVKVDDNDIKESILILKNKFSKC